jgi:spermidine synthase
MIPWVQLGEAEVPDDGGHLRLMQRGGEFSIMAGPIELMNNRLSGSEEALAALTCAHLQGPEPHVLIGGLGMGFTLRAALKVLGPKAKVTVAELVPEVIAWARGPLAAIHGESLDDPRVTLFQGDVDNGPEGLMRRANDDLYDDYGLTEARTALRSGGVLAVWSSSPHAPFAKRLRTAGFAVEERKVSANGRGGGARHVIWLATKR